MKFRYIKLTSKSILTIIFLIIISIYSCSNETKFDAKKWKSYGASESTHFVRWPMIHDLVKNYNLIGMSRKDVFLLLGEPIMKSSYNISYDLGPTGIGVNYGVLELIVSDEKIIKYLIIEH